MGGPVSGPPGRAQQQPAKGGPRGVPGAAWVDPTIWSLARPSETPNHHTSQNTITFTCAPTRLIHAPWIEGPTQNAQS
ncbi:unnamed protein product [Gadus morhua 'NCC']